MNDERLRELYAASLLSRSGPSGHPAPEALAALARREGPEDVRLGTLDHVMGCVACRRDFDLLRTVERAGVEAEVTNREATGRRWFVPAALAASLLLAVGIGRQMVRNPADDTTRGGEAGGVVLVQPGAETRAGEPLTFTWRPVAGANRYQLELLDSAGAVAASAATTDTTAAPEAVGALPPGQYRWWVRALLADTRTARSPLRDLRLTAE